MSRPAISFVAGFVLGVLVGAVAVQKGCPPVPAPADTTPPPVTTPSVPAPAVQSEPAK